MAGKDTHDCKEGDVDPEEAGEIPSDRIYHHSVATQYMALPRSPFRMSASPITSSIAAAIRLNQVIAVKVCRFSRWVHRRIFLLQFHINLQHIDHLLPDQPEPRRDGVILTYLFDLSAHNPPWSRS